MDTLRFITCGSVDDGKSTLIGRLLYETKLIFDDQLEALKLDSQRFGTQGDRSSLHSENCFNLNNSSSSATIINRVTLNQRTMSEVS